MASPLEIDPPDDTGADVFRRFRYQARLAVPYCLACAMRNDVISIVPEHIEDLAIEYSWGWKFIQIKTRDLALGPWKLRDVIMTGGLRSLFRSHKCLKHIDNIKFELHLEGAIFRRDPLNELLDTSSQRSKRFTQQVAQALSAEEEEVAAFLKLVRLVERESRDSVSKHNQALILKIAPFLTGIKADFIQEKIVAEISSAMGLEKLGNSWPKYLFESTLCQSTEYDKVMSKRITYDNLLQIKYLLDNITKSIQNISNAETTYVDIIHLPITSGQNSKNYIEKSIYNVTEEYKKIYFKHGNSQDFSTLADVVIENYEKQTDYYASYQLARLYTQVAFMEINTGINDNIIKARKLLEKSCENVHNLNIYSQETNDLFAMSRWLLSITYCLCEDYNKAMAICEEALCDVDKNYKTKIGSIILEREMFLLTQSCDYIDRIKVDRYEDNRIQYFQTKRRIFEYHLRKHDINKANELFPETFKLFNYLSNVLEKIYIITFYKDLYIYFTLKSEKSIADHYFKMAMTGFDKYGYKGQKSILDKLKHTYDK